ncbi:MAG: CaiB/BaiF CoA transferase family protein [Candidatus Hodarchaeales archaeon]|jgi:crotonobetainyl-CoA:carnitine CoA-transferase CaiB-like acyl-CoA transferase
MPFRSILTGIRILDLTSNLPGPLATQILGDFGADVIKVESLSGDPIRHYPPFIENDTTLNLLLNRNKRSIAIDLKSTEGLDIFYQLVKTCDVIITSYRNSSIEKLKIDFATLTKINPKLVYCHLTGYHRFNDQAGHDINYLGKSGILHITGPKKKPIAPGVPIADIGGGSLPMVITVLGGLMKRNTETPEPQFYDISMTEHMIPWLTVVATEYLTNMENPSRELHALSGYVPWYTIYQTKDDKFVTFAPIENKFWQQFCLAIERKDLLDQQFNLELCEQELPEIFQQRSLNEWDNLFKEFKLPGGAILSIQEVLSKKGRLTTINHPTVGNVQVISSPFLNSDQENHMKPAPSLGQHTKEILTEIGLKNELERLQQAKVVLFDNSKF